MSDEIEATCTDPIEMAKLLIACIVADKRDYGMHLEVLGYTLMNLGCKTVGQLNEAIYHARCEWDL